MLLLECNVELKLVEGTRYLQSMFYSPCGLARTLLRALARAALWLVPLLARAVRAPQAHDHPGALFI